MTTHLSTSHHTVLTSLTFLDFLIQSNSSHCQCLPDFNNLPSTHLLKSHQHHLVKTLKSAALFFLYSATSSSQDTNHAIVDYPAFPCRICDGKHRAINCPLQYFLKYNEPCPGFNKDGSRISSAWTGNKLNSPTRLLWKSYIDRHGLIRPKSMSEDVKF